MDNQKDNHKWSHYVSLKGHKLTQAVYLVTSLLPDSEPLKWRLRDIALDVLSDVSVLDPGFDHSSGLSSTGSNSQLSPLFKVPVLESASTKVGQLISWFEVALAGNFSADLNLVLVRNEYQEFNKLLQERIKSTGLNKLVHLSTDDLLLPASAPATISPAEENKKTLSNMSHSLSHKQESHPMGHKEVGESPYQKLSRLPHKSRDVAKDSRRSLIISFLKGKDWTSIKDITEAISGCSAKTIQRELSDLVHQGVLKKKGDRRWSRYLLS